MLQGAKNITPWGHSIKDTLNKGHLSKEDTACSPNHIELCTNLPLDYLSYRAASWVPIVFTIERFHYIHAAMS